MAVSVAKLSLVIGAGLVGSALTDGGSLSDVTSLFSGALRIVTKHLKLDKNISQSSGKSKSDALLTQISGGIGSPCTHYTESRAMVSNYPREFRPLLGVHQNSFQAG